MFIGGFAGEEGVGGTTDTPTGYMAPLQTEILDHDIVYTYNYSLILGSVDEIRDYAVEQSEKAKTPDWKFEQDRQNWHYQAANNEGTDAGWPINGFVELDLSKRDMTAISPPTVWNAEDAPKLYIEAAFKTDKTRTMVGWSPYNGTEHNPVFSNENSTQFDILGDGNFRIYEIDLSQVPSYIGTQSYLFIKPLERQLSWWEIINGGGNSGSEEWVKIKRIWFE